MTTGRIDYSPDYKSESKAARLAVAGDRALRPSLYEGMDRQQAELRIAAERQRLRDAVVEAATEESKMEEVAANGSNTITRTDALIKMQEAARARRGAVDALIEFESKQEPKK